jgi:hypothetical protein
MTKTKKAKEYPSPLLLDLGCGPRRRVDRDTQGNVVRQFWGVDIREIEGVDEAVDIRERWPWGTIQSMK